MRYYKFLMCALPLLAVAACSDSDGVTDLGAPEPKALVRFINAVPDTGTVDFAFVDIVENLPSLKEVAFQSSSGFYQRAEAGTRPVRIFPNSTNIDLTSIRLVDTTVDLKVNTRYTMVFAGRAADGSHGLEIIEDPATPPTPPAGSIALQVLNLAVGMGAVDVYIVPVDERDDPVPADFATDNVAVVSNVGYLKKAGDYINVPALDPLADADGPYYMFIVTAAGSTTPIFHAVPDATGEPAPSSGSYGPQPGVQIEGSVLTAVVMSGATPGTRQSTITVEGVEMVRPPTVLVIADKVLNP